MKVKTIKRSKTLARLGIEGAIIALFRPSKILIRMNELVNLVRWHKKRKGKWTTNDENKALCLKMMAGEHYFTHISRNGFFQECKLWLDTVVHLVS